MTSLEEKAAGAVAWGKGEFQVAIERFSASIEKSDPDDKTFLKTLYSNRSAAFMKVQNKTAALLDAEKCVEIDSNWPKGFIRKGDALFSMAKYTEAYNAYNSAHRLDSSDSGVKNKCNLAEKAIRESANPSSSSSSSPASSATASRPASYLTSAQAYLRLFVLVNAVGYLCSVLLAPAMARFCYRNFVFASIADYLLAVHSAHGLPKLNMEYAQRLMLDPSSMYLFLSLLLLMQPPSVLSMAPIFLTALVHSTHYMHGVVQQKSPDTVAKAGELVGKYLPSLMKQSPEAWAGMTASAKWRVFDQQVVATACLCEVLQGLALLLQLVLPSRNFLAAMMWWQYLQMRYMMDQQQQQQQGGAAGVGGGIKKAFAGVDSRLSGMLAHRFCPRGLGLGYGYLRTFLANKVKLPEPGEPAPSMSNMIPKSCTIM